ncbi:flippase [Parendozoicomonas haliclonae]|uniref:flippase n=1 Tax=Parendozoicomonas haliclonae TaxID=1960125 RepID=UPI001A98CF9D|nr:flippase [Parendozoicomonas haliclonae]
MGNKEKKRLVINIFSLSVLQGANYILPLLTIPYLVRVLGPDLFGLLAFGTATSMYFMLITDYGFNLSATRQISIYRDNTYKVNEIFSAVMIIKITLMIISLILMSVLVLSFNKFHQDWEVYYLSFGMVLGQVIFPVWLFQGMERMKYITYLNICSKAFFTICIFIFVQNKDDYLLVPLLTSLGYVIAGIISLYIIKKEFDVKFIWQNLSVLKEQLKEGWHIFFSSIAVSLYTISTTFILGLLTDNTIVGYFSAADKIVKAVKGLYAPIAQAIYPMIGKKMHENQKEGVTFIQKTTWIVGGGMFLISTVLFVLADQIVNIMLGWQYAESILLLKIMAFLPFIICLSNIFGIQTMLNLGYKKEFSVFVVIGAALGMILIFCLTPIYAAVGVSVSILLVEMLITIMLGIFLIFKFKKGKL